MGKTIAQAYIEEGEVIGRQKASVEQTRKILIRLATRQLNVPPDEATANTLNAIGDWGRLERMIDRHIDATTWAELLAVE